MRKYYGVAGTRGYGVYNNWYQARNARTKKNNKTKEEKSDTEITGDMHTDVENKLLYVNDDGQVTDKKGKRSWSMNHTGNVKDKMEEAKNTLFLADRYMEELGKEFENLRKITLSDKKVMDYIEILLPIEDGATPQQFRNMKRLQEDMKMRYFDAPDLKDVGKNAYRFINAVSDFATHADPLRRTKNYKENMFAKTVEGNPLIDRAYQLVLSA